jgi:H/ACA ribonucleoprotein complex subunit 4
MVKQFKDLLDFSILNIDKPSGPTSFTISNYVRRRISNLGVNKTSHFGTLDPKVTGVLPVAIGRACKLTGYFIGHDKVYVGILHTHKEQKMVDLQKIIGEKFVGKIKQTPPVRSAVARRERTREVMKFELVEESEDGKNFLFFAEVEGGTYIRKLCSDLGEEIGGAHMGELRRIRAGLFEEKDSITLYEFDEIMDKAEKGNLADLKKALVPAEEAIKKILPVVQIKEKNLKQILTGKPLFKNDLVGDLPKDQVFAVFLKDRFIEIAERVDDSDTRRKNKYGGDIVARALFVRN